MREIVLDTETTGISPRDGHRIIEIGALELMHHLPTGSKLHIYINPERDIDDGAVAVHGLTNLFLSDKPLFSEIVDEFLSFIGDAPLVIHNASFDMGFINAELHKIQHPTLPMERAIDTLAMARKKFPGAQANLNALCRRFEIDNSHRDLHGALVDADLLASVYVELLGGRQPGLSLGAENKNESMGVAVNSEQASSMLQIDHDKKPVRPIRPHAPSVEETAAHNAFLAKLKDPIWLKT
jgi:DNA polymerase III, epsilon subunit, Proteobacterial